MEKVKQLFDEIFKFGVNQEVRHRGDTKSYSADMGLFVLSRYLAETSDDEGNCLYEKTYVCRMVRFSGSGEMAQFREKELISIEEYNKKSLADEVERNSMRTQMRQVHKEVFDLFGVADDSEIYLKKDGKIDTSAIYKPSGFSRNEKGTKLSLRKMVGWEFGDESAEVSSKDEFEIKVKE